MRRNWLPRLTAETVIVHVGQGGPSLRGVLANVYADSVALRDVRVLDPEASIEVQGDVLVPRANIQFLQVLREPV